MLLRRLSARLLFMTSLPMSARLENFLQYFRMFVTGTNLRDMVDNLPDRDLLCGTNKEFFVDIQEYLYEFYSIFHEQVCDEIDMTMHEMKIPVDLRKKFYVWYSELDIEDDFEFIRSCFLSDNPEEFFGYGVLYEIADTDSGIEHWDPQETANLKQVLEHWICSERRKDFLEKMADDHIDALTSLSKKY
jgi:hypothetical protein